MFIVLLGAPGSGKGTVAKILKEEFQILHISTGDLLKNVPDEELNKKIMDYIVKGELVPDEIIIKVLENYLNSADLSNGVIFDGFPRTYSQAEYLDKMLSKNNLKIDYVLNLDMKDEDIIYRTVKRRICKKCGAIYNLEYKKPKVEGICDNCGEKLYHREEDNYESLKVRLEVYHNEANKIEKYYDEQGKLLSIPMKLGQNLEKEDLEKLLK